VVTVENGYLQAYEKRRTKSLHKWAWGKKRSQQRNAQREENRTETQTGKRVTHHYWIPEKQINWGVIHIGG